MSSIEITLTVEGRRKPVKTPAKVITGEDVSPKYISLLRGDIEAFALTEGKGGASYVRCVDPDAVTISTLEVL